MALRTTPPFDAEAYWAPFEYKKWVVDMYSMRKRSIPGKPAKDRKIVRARTKEGAIRTALVHTCLTGRIGGSARLATPTDLGARPYPPEDQHNG